VFTGVDIAEIGRPEARASFELEFGHALAAALNTAAAQHDIRTGETPWAAADVVVDSISAGSVVVYRGLLAFLAMVRSHCYSQ
jgi:hypothetical protein